MSHSGPINVLLLPTIAMVALACGSAPSQTKNNRRPVEVQVVGSDDSGATTDDQGGDVDTTEDGITDPPPGDDGTETGPIVNQSKGTGGVLGLVEVQYTDLRGLASRYKINAPADSGPDKPYGLHIHLHGDGGGGYVDFPNVDTRKNLIGVTVRAPNASLQWGRAQGVAHAGYLNDLIDKELIKKYNVDLDRIYFSGVSGGAYFLSGHFIPMHGRRYNTGAFLMCGGMTPQVQFDQPQFLKNFRVHWQVTAGERTDITMSVNAAIQAYRSAATTAGADPNVIQSSEFVGAGGHCEFDGIDYTSGIQYMMDLKFDTVVKT